MTTLGSLAWFDRPVATNNEVPTTVKTIEAIRLTFQPPEHGWLPLKLELGDFVLDDIASGVLNDPIDEFFEALAFCDHPTSAGYRVRLWMEPGGYAIDMQPASDSERCVIRIWSYADFIPPLHGQEGMTVEFDGEVETARVSRVISSAFGELLRPDHQASLDAWAPGQTYLQRFRAMRDARRMKPLP